MKVMFDTNIYISFIRNNTYTNILQERGTIKYISAIVLMELWAGAKTVNAERLLSQLQKSYMDADRIVTLNVYHYIYAGKIFSTLPVEYRALLKMADFINDVQIAMTALSIGATLYTENMTHFNIIKSQMEQLKISYLTADY